MWFRPRPTWWRGLPAIAEAVRYELGHERLPTDSLNSPATTCGQMRGAAHKIPVIRLTVAPEAGRSERSNKQVFDLRRPLCDRVVIRSL